MLKNRTLFEKVEILFLVAAVLGCLDTLLTIAREAALPYQMDFGEGPLLAIGVRVAHGLSIYPPDTELPYIINPYGPLPHYLAGLCVKLFGVSFTAPRILVLLFGIWCAALIALLVHHWGGTAPVSLAFGLLYLSRPVVTAWLPIFRVDLIGLALSLTGLYLFAKFRHWYISIPFFIAAVFCKIVLVSAPLACLLYAVFRKETRKALWFAMSVLALGTLGFLWAQRETGGWFAFHTVWASAGHPYRLSAAIRMLHTEFIADYFLIALALVLVYYLRSRPELSLPLLYLGLALLMSLTVGKVGAAFNYLLEWQAVLCCCAGVAYGYLRTQSDLRSMASALLPAALALMVGVNLHRLTSDSMRELTECGQAYEYVKGYPGGRILSENVGAVIMAGRPLQVFEPLLWTREVLDKGWPDTEIVGLIRSRQFDLAVVGSLMKDQGGNYYDVWPDSVKDAIEQNYTLVRTFNCTNAELVYRPANAPNKGF